MTKASWFFYEYLFINEIHEMKRFTTHQILSEDTGMIFDFNVFLFL